MIDPIPALGTAVIWAISPIYYRDYLVINDVVRINFYRLFYASLGLFLPFIIFGFNDAIIYGSLSGLLTLAVGDTLYLFSIREVGASIAAPVAYTYVLLIQFTAVFLGEQLTINRVVSSMIIILGIYMLSDSKGSARRKGIVMALLTALLWTVGQSSIKLATMGYINPLSIAFARTTTAMSALGLYMLINRKNRFNAKIDKKHHILLATISISDLGLGSALYIYSIGIIGLTITIILTSVSPLLTQIVSKILGKENPSTRDVIAGFLIVTALIIAVI
ncbi:MAG: DMT family transporter [Thermoprotei archaeon]